MKRLIAVSLILLLCFSPAEAAKKKSAKKKAQPKPPATKWYEGGTLHDKLIKDWQKATTENKLASCGYIVASTYYMGKAKFHINDIDDLKPYATQLMLAIQLAVKDDPECDDIPVSTMAVSAMYILGWLKL